MPPEPKVKVKRRSSKRDVEEYKFDGGHARELELKRSRGEVSCAECRRLKIKCDKQIPCTSCQRRGCSALCPNGSLATGQGTRFVLAATEHLHRKISRLSGRIRELEDALANVHSKYAPDDQQPHPLLESDWLLEQADDDDELEPGSNRGRKIGKLPSDMQGRPMSVGAVGDDLMDESDGSIFTRRSRGSAPGDVIDAFGTLSISNNGISRFFGPTGGSESLLITNLHSTDPPPVLPQTGVQNSSPPATQESSSPPSSHHSRTTGTTAFASTSTLDPRVTLFSHRFPFTPLALPPPQIQELIESYLPPYERACEIVNTYFEQVAWLFRGVSREQLEEEMLNAIYSRKHARDRGENVKTDDHHSGDHFVKLTQKDGPEDLANEDEIVLQSSRSGGDYKGPHDVALLFMIFAVGALVEPFPSNTSDSPLTNPSPCGSSPHSNSGATASRPSPNALGEHYHQLAQAALSLQPVLEKPSIVTIQCLHVMSIFNAMSGEGTANPSSAVESDSSTESRTGQSETSMEMTWSLITMAAHLSQTIGLHRDSERWGLSPKMVQRRRILFWDLFVADVWQSLNTGRPPSFSLAYIDCGFPQYEGVNMKNEGAEGKANGLRGSADYENKEKTKRAGYAFEIWQFRFAAECVAEVISRTLTAEAPTYDTIMELDRKVREFSLPEGFTDRGAAKDAGLGGVPNSFGLDYSNPPTVESECSDSNMSFSFMKCVLDHIRETVLIYLHRAFFAQAIIEQPMNPLKSVYAPSFLAAYRSSATILKSVREQFVVWPNSSARFWTMWTFAFSAAVVFGTVVTRGPRSPLAISAMAELDQACILFTKAAMYSKRATKALPILTNLREKAHHTLAAAQSKNPELSLSDGELWNIKKEELDPNDELSIFAGHTRLVSTANRNLAPSGPSNSTELTMGIQSSAFATTSVQNTDSPQNELRQHRSSSQLRPQFNAIDVDMEPSGKFERMYNPDPRPIPPGYQSSHHPPLTVRPHLPRISNSGSYEDERCSDMNDWYSRQRESSYNVHGHHNHPPTISIPPAPTPSSVDERSPMQFNYSYDRSRSGPSPVAGSNYTWSPSESYPSRHSSSPVRLSHPQYGPATSQVQPETSMHNFHNQPPPPHQMYSGPGVTGFGPPPQLHLHPIHPGPPGHAALADLGLASRDSRLDERWSSFMQDSGILENIERVNR
ncbi:fungal-specific transcription factor domain-containing protein [Rhodocollybia butyracea]|uniref:Fungal-specific transcription factor domain-containing protein n=1 Tax=Rhodocollybia butyracea TaxID=206335 RepID=A0A9P5PBS8_9AGAR|nr:fungal-specific transcription factor domain-containing protein [Rhodocollybia butyracea]